MCLSHSHHPLLRVLFFISWALSVYVCHRIDFPAEQDLSHLIFDGRGNTTIVTAYFAFGRNKYTFAAYKKWSRRLLRVKSPMVIFTNVRGVFERMRPYPTRTKFVYTEFEDVEIVKTHLARIKRVVPARRWVLPWHYVYKSPELFAMWYAKSEFVRLAAESDPFNTKYFVWADIGCSRETTYDVAALPEWPSRDKERLLDGPGVLMSSPRFYSNAPCSSLDWRWDNGSAITSHSGMPKFASVLDIPEALIETPEGGGTEFLVAGAVFGGTRDEMLRYAHVYQTEMVRYLYSDRPVHDLDDQYMMVAVACVHPDLIRVVRDSSSTANDRSPTWFFLMKYLS